jgi:hypothetical protein
LAYWIRARSTETLLIVLTDGDIVWDNERGDFDWERTTALPCELSNVFHGEPFWVDLRWTQKQQLLTNRNPEFLRAVAKLAAPIRNLDLEALIGEDHKQHRRTMQAACTAVVTITALLAVAGWEFRSRQAALEGKRDQQVLASVARSYQLLPIDPLRAVDEAHTALIVKETVQGSQALRTGVQVGLGRRDSKQDERQVFGSGDAYLMGRWRRGEVFSRLRNDGRFALVASERGKDGPDPPGNVYLINIDNLRTTELQAGEQAKGRRLEYMGFSTSGKEIFVARQFYLDIYNLEGTRTNSVQLEFHAKPTHIISGMFGSYVLVGDTVGHLMLADTLSNKRPQLEISRRHPGAALFIESNTDGKRALVVFESGRAELVILDDVTSPGEFALDMSDTIYAAFSPSPSSNEFLTSSRSGKISLWQFAVGRPVQLASFDHGGTPVGLASFSADGNRIVSVGDDGSYKIWDIGARALVASYPGAGSGGRTPQASALPAPRL